MSAPTPVTLVGATGLTGSASLRYLLTSPSALAITSVTRRAAPAPWEPSTTGSSYTNRVLPDLTTATTTPEPLSTKGGVYVSCLGTTRAQVGGDIKKQEAIDLDMNKVLFERAKKDGASTAILVSTYGANAASYFAYGRMKGQLEDDVQAMDFERTVILRPATLLHDSQRPDARFAETAMIKIIKGLRFVGVPTGMLGVESDNVGAAIAQLVANPPAATGTTFIYDADIEKLAAEYHAAQKK